MRSKLRRLGACWLVVRWFGLLAAASSAATGSATAQNSAQNSAERPAAASCFTAPTRLCLIEEALRIAENNDDFSARVMIARAQVKAGLNDQAVTNFRKALQIIQGPGLEQYRGGMAAAVALGQLQAGLSQDAATTFALASQYAMASLRSADQFEFIGKMQARAGDLAGAEASAQSANLRAGSMIRREIVDADLKLGKLDDALKVALSITVSDDIRADALTAVVRFLMDQNKLAEAQQAASLIGSEQFGAAALAEIARGQRQAGQIVLSVTNFLHAIETARLVRDDELRSKLLGDIARAQSSAGLSKDAIETIASAVAPIKTPATPGQMSTLAGLIFLEADLGYFAEALALTRSLEGKASITKPLFLYRIAVDEAKKGMVVDATKLANAIEDPKLHAKALAEIALVL